MLVVVSHIRFDACVKEQQEEERRRNTIFMVVVCRSQWQGTLLQHLYTVSRSHSTFGFSMAEHGRTNFHVGPVAGPLGSKRS